MRFVRALFFIGGRVLSFIVAAVAGAIDITGTSVGDASENTVRNVVYIATIIFVVLTLLRELELWLRQRPKLTLQLPKTESVKLGKTGSFDLLIRNGEESAGAERVRLEITNISPLPNTRSGEPRLPVPLWDGGATSEINPGGSEWYHVLEIVTQSSEGASYFVIQVPTYSGAIVFKPEEIAYRLGFVATAKDCSPRKFRCLLKEASPDKLDVTWEQ